MRVLLVFIFAFSPQVASAQLVSNVESQVSDELVSAGISLNRLGMRLRIEPTSDGALLTLLDASGRVVKTRILRPLPSDPSAQIASCAVAVAQMIGKPLEYEPKPLAPVVREPAAPKPKPTSSKRIWIGDGELQFKNRRVRHRFDLDAQAYRGDEKTPLTGSDFYVAVGRKDLADEYDTRWGLRTVGIVMTVGGVVSMIASYASYQSNEPDQFGFRYYSSGQTAAAGLGFLAAVSGGVIWLVYHNPHPVSVGERHNLARQHNIRLKGKLTRPAAQTWMITPFVNERTNGGGLLVMGRF